MIRFDYIIILTIIYGQIVYIKSVNNFCMLNSGEANKTCYVKDNGYFLLCHDGLHNQWTKGSRMIRTLIICEWSDKYLDLKLLLMKFPALKELVISNSNLTILNNISSVQADNLEKIEITNTLLNGIPKDFFVKLPVLKSLDLRNNSLSSLNPHDIDSSSLQNIYLSGNNWICDSSMEWILNSSTQSLASKIIDKQSLLCSKPYKGRPLIPVIEVIKSLKTECQKSVCECILIYVVGRSGIHTARQLMAFASMNCSYRGLKELPSFLPANISALYLTGNQITDLTPLKTNPFYKHVLDIYLDDNLIESISILDGTYWLEHFRLLSLRGNKLTYLPTYALEYILLHSTNAVSLYLGNNPWKCDCLFTPGFQELLIRYPTLVKDINDVKCAESDNDKNYNKQIRDLTRTEICVSPANRWISPLDVVNIVLVLLIIIVLGKLIYDYKSFKKSGRLPWIVSKIP